MVVVSRGTFENVSARGATNSQNPVTKAGAKLEEQY